jgi:hypothetical protein
MARRFVTPVRKRCGWTLATVLPAVLLVQATIHGVPQRQLVHEEVDKPTVAAQDREELTSLGLPLTIQIDAVFNDVVKDMLRGSATFREQSVRLSRFPHLMIRLKLSLRRPEGGTFSRARCRISRYEFGHVDAQVELWSLQRAAELIAHEFEHVAEYAEGVNYQRLARVRDSGVWLTPTGAFETRRAVRMGQDVALEISPIVSASR